jgi:hypothetical protein
MATIQWAQLCESAFLDNCGRLCLIGITRRLPVPKLPLAVYQLMIAAHVVDVQVGDELNVEAWIMTPRGVAAAPNHPEGLNVTVAADYLLLTLRDVPLTEEGIYTICLALDGTDPVTLEVPVLLASTPVNAVLQ